MSAKLPAIMGKDLLRALRKAGWDVSHVRGSHHQLKHRESGKRVTIPVHAGKTLKKGLLSGILRELGMSQEELRALL